MVARERWWLLLVDAQAALLITTGCSVPLLVAMGLRLAFNRTEELVLAIGVVFAVSAGTALWIFRKLRTCYTRHQARAVAKAFILFAPIALAISIPLAVFPGALAERLFGSAFTLVGAFSGVVGMVTLISFGFSMAALKVSQWP